MRTPETTQSTDYIKKNLKLGDWVKVKGLKGGLMVMSFLENKQICLGNGPQRVFKRYSEIECILIED